MPETTLEAEAPAPQPTAVAEPATWREEFEQQWLQSRLAHEAIMLDKMQKTIARGERLANFAVSGNASDIVSEGEDVGVSLGNKITNNYYNTEQTATTSASPAAPPTATQPAAPVASAGSAVVAGVYRWVKPALIGASLLGGGGLGGVVLTKMLTPSSPPATVIQGDTDTNAGLRFKQ